MRTAAFLLVLTFVVVAFAAPVPPPNAREATKLIEKLASPDFAEREAATQRLEELGPLALDELRAACKSDDAEVADRAKDLVRKIERRMASDRALAPTMVELDAKDTALDDVLASLSKQAGCDVVLGGLKPDELAGKKISVSTGKVPFWSAVLAVCDAADLQIANVSGFAAPGAMPYHPRPKAGAGARVAAVPSLAVVLEDRAGAKKRPASVRGAILIEALEVPKVAAAKDVSAAVLQVWPEPKIAWQSTTGMKVIKATEPDGRKLIPDLSPLVVPQVQKIGGDVIAVKNPDGSVTIINTRSSDPIKAGGNFTPNVRQTLVKLKGSAPVAGELSGAVFGVVRSGVEPLATVALDEKAVAPVKGAAGVELSASVRTAAGKTVVNVRVTYDPLAVQTARASDELPGAPNAADRGNQTLYGLRVTDADGRAFDLSLVSAKHDFVPGSKWVTMQMELALIAPKDNPAKPAKVVMWGTYPKSVDVPFTLKDVPLVGGK